MAGLATAPESLFWYWISERHAIYLRRQAGQSKPWTNDPILRDWKFTNPFRENDEGTVWLREHFLKPHRDDNLGLVAFNICWYRAFNYIGTGEGLGWQTEWDAPKMKAILHAAADRGNQIFTGAHIIRGAFDTPKIDSIVDVCSDLYRLCTDPGEEPDSSWFVDLCRAQRSLQEAFEQLKTVKYIGPFQAYEMVTDMRHTRLLEDATDIMTWANPGPGAKRGLQRLNLPSTPDRKAIESMRLLLSHAPGSGFAPFFDSLSPIEYPVFEMRDIEHSLCEFDKYCRVKFGEGQPRSRYSGAA